MHKAATVHLTHGWGVNKENDIRGKGAVPEKKCVRNDDNYRETPADVLCC